MLFRYVLIAGLALFVQLSFAQGNGKLQIHYMNVGQGDGEVVISPKGQVVMIDNGPPPACTNVLTYLDSISVKDIDFEFNSHYHQDHFGCNKKVFSHVSLKTAAYDRGLDFPSHDVPSLVKPKPGSAYARYVDSVGSKRKEAKPGDVVTLDADSDSPVRLTIIATNGAGISTTNENDLSVVLTLEFGKFRTEFGGDLSGENASLYQDIETTVAPNIGQIDVYKVHHHCSSYSTNAAWLAATKPTVAIISAGNGNVYHHPAKDCLDRLHQSSIKKVYWTNTGSGGKPDPTFDVIAGGVVVEVEPNAKTFTLRSPTLNTTETYPIAGANN